MALVFSFAAEPWIRPVYFILILSMTTICCHCSKQGPRCNATVNGDLATLRFMFTLDSKHPDVPNFSVHRLRGNGSSERDTWVISCNWDNRTAMECHPPSEKIQIIPHSDGIEVKFLNATSWERDGRYEAREVGTNGKSRQPEQCRLNIAGVPDTPSDFRAVNSTWESVTLCWKIPPEKGISCRLNYGPANTEGKYHIHSCPPDITCCSITGLEPGTEYKVSIQAGNEFGWSIPHDLQTSIKTKDLPCINVSDNVYMILFYSLLGMVGIGVSVLCFRYKRRNCRQDGAGDNDKKGYNEEETSGRNVQRNYSPVSQIEDNSYEKCTPQPQTDTNTSPERRDAYENVPGPPVSDNTDDQGATNEDETEDNQQSDKETDDNMANESTLGLLKSGDGESAQ